jgi:hypothetical protein
MGSRRILYYMSLLVHATAAPRPVTPSVRIVSIALAGIFAILATSQLYSFEEFPNVIASFWLPGGNAFAQLCAALLVTGEVLALPFLLFMRLSPVMRIVSMVAGWGIVAGWLAISLWINLSVNAVTNSGVLGATVPVAPGWWMVGLFVVLGMLTAWVSWNGFSSLQQVTGGNEL